MRGEFADDLPDVVDESHVQHPVGFIEHEKLDFAKSKRVALDEVEQAPGRRHEHIDPVEQRTDLGPHRDPPITSAPADIQVTAVGVEAVEDLARKFARRTEHQHAARLARRLPPIGREVMQDRQRKSRRLAGAGLRDTDHVTTRQATGMVRSWIGVGVT